MRKNVASQIVDAQLINKADGTPCTTGTTTVYVSGDGGPQAAAGGSPSVFHLGQGVWSYVTTAAETNYDHVAFTFVNSAAINVTVQIYTSFPQTGDNYARLGAPAGASVSADIAAVKAVDDAIKVKTDFLPSATAGAAGGVFIAGTNAATTITTALTTTFTGNLTGSVGSVTGAVGSVTGNVGGNVTGSVGSIATGGIAAASFAAGAIDAAAIATDAIDADSLKSDAITEIQAGLATAAALATVSGFVDTEVAAIKTVTDKLNSTLISVGSPTDFIFTAEALALAPSGTGASAVAIADEVQTRTIAAVTVVNGLAANSVNASALATDAVTEIQSGLATAAALSTVSGFVDTEVAAIKAVTDKLDTTMVSVGSPTDYGFTVAALANAPTGSAPSAAVIADAVFDEVVDGTTTFRESTRLHNAALGGKASGLATTTAVYRDLADTKDRVTATVDADGNRSAVTLDLAP